MLAGRTARAAAVRVGIHALATMTGRPARSMRMSGPGFPAHRGTVRPDQRHGHAASARPAGRTRARDGLDLTTRRRLGCPWLHASASQDCLVQAQGLVRSHPRPRHTWPRAWERGTLSLDALAGRHGCVSIRRQVTASDCMREAQPRPAFTCPSGARLPSGPAVPGPRSHVFPGSSCACDQVREPGM